MQVTPLHRWPAEPAPARSAGTGFPSSRVLSPALEVVLEWAPSQLAVLLSGSHAEGSAVWVEHEGLAVSLSDVDLYVLLEDEAACRAARARQRASLSGLARRCSGFGLAAPLEAGFHTPAGISRLPARPGTLELARHGRVLRGDERAAALVPRFSPADVSLEEITLLLENRGCELLWCRPRLHSGDRLSRLTGRHSVLKCALDLAGVTVLLGGEYPDGQAARVARARERRAGLKDSAEAAATRDLDRLWDTALSWREGNVAELAPPEAEAEWLAVARAWAGVWREVGDRVVTRAPQPPVERALALARRARLRRRLKEALTGAGGAAPMGFGRIARGLGGTLRHRVYGSAALLLLEAAAGSARALPSSLVSALERLGVVGGTERSDWEDASRAVVRAWDRRLLDGQRTAEPA